MQIWQHADQNRTGFLGRQEFYNALKLVTVAQSKRELTPDIVKAALYGPASSKIPAPQINLAALPPAQPNPMAPRPPTQQPGIVNSMAPRPPTQQPGVVNSMQTQTFGIRSQGPPNSMAPPSVAPPSGQYFAPQGNQSMRPPPQSGPLPSQGVGGPSFPAGGGLAGPGLSNSNVSGDWLGGRGVGATVPKPQEPLSSSSFTAPRPSVGGNAITSAAMFGGDLFSASQSISKPSSSSITTQTASIPPVSSAIAPVTSEPQTPAKIDPLGALNAFTRQPTGGPVQSAGPSLPRPNQQAPTQNAPVQSGGPSLPQWPKMTRAGVNKYMKVFMEVDSDRDGKITGDQARSLFLSWRLPRGKYS